MNWYKNLKISTKLIVAFLIIALIAGVVGVVGIINLNTMNQNDQTLYKVHTQGISYNADAEIGYMKTRFNAIKMTISEDDETLNDCIEQIGQNREETDHYLSLYEEIADDPEVKSMYDEICATWTAYQAYVDRALDMVAGGDLGGAQKMLMEESADYGHSPAIPV